LPTNILPLIKCIEFSPNSRSIFQFSGHRHIPLKDDHGNFTKHSYLATHIEIEETGKNGGVGSPRICDKIPKIHNSLLHKRLNFVKASRTDGSMTTEETNHNRLKIQGNPYEVFFIERYETTV
jgi:hypothetical protein